MKIRDNRNKDQGKKYPCDTEMGDFFIYGSELFLNVNEDVAWAFESYDYCYLNDLDGTNCEIVKIEISIVE